MNIYSNCGICIGASSVSAVCLEPNNNNILKIVYSFSIPHNGNPQSIVKSLLESNQYNKVTSTGRNFKDILNTPSISEAESIEYALQFLKLKPEVVISAGAENFIIYILDKNYKISKVVTGNKCASGTGEFFVQQLKRMDIKLEETAGLVSNGTPYNISGRCSVFCKSDCTHALNKGVNKADIVSGLSKMMADKIINLIPRYKEKSILLIGNTIKNEGFVTHLKNRLPNLFVNETSGYFEALGAAYFSYYNDIPNLDYDNLFKQYKTAFTFHPPLSLFTDKVKFEKMIFQKALAGDECIVGLDVGSTTTKAVILRINDNAILASEYLRTNGNPLTASKNCYISLNKQITEKINIIGLGVTGSGREISGLHAQTDSIINEIIAHSTATLFFDKEVDTIFEIGGQDAKYTHITAGTASDYAMNEACSAGTGSFLEEAAGETLNVDYLSIADLALAAKNPPNFNDQCSAFISSDIKNALHDGISTNDVLAGLVYSICLNYINRVKGNRPTGKKIFMQGGVCYNKAVPIAMAALTNKEIIVPPEPGLMGAFGVALEVKKRIEKNLLEKKLFSLLELIEREINFDKSFVCIGGKDNCDRKCQISVFNINGKLFPFGGACNLYNTIKTKDKPNITTDYVKIRQDLVFNKYINSKKFDTSKKTIGILKSFLTNTYYPLFYNYFSELGFNVILESVPNPVGVEKVSSSFCYPVELSHAFMENLISKKPNYIFIPHIKELAKKDYNKINQKTCVLVQSESYYLTSAFKDELNGINILSPVINFNNLFDDKLGLIKTAIDLGINKEEAHKTLSAALKKQNEMFAEFKEHGKHFIDDLKADPEEIGIVLIGRSYNAFAEQAHLGIPRKFTSRNISIVPMDFLDFDMYESINHMYWGTGTQIVKTAKLIVNNPQLFGVYITNFSCGPDSFLLGYFRDIMESKPSLTLELDSHSADAGINTRIEAAIDIFRSFSKLKDSSSSNDNLFIPIQVSPNYEIYNHTKNKKYSLYDSEVKILLPSMGIMSSEAMRANFKYFGINSEVLPIYDHNTLKLGRGNTLCKECLPLQLCTGALVDYYNNKKNSEEISLFFMSAGNGPCRLGQYTVFLENFIKKNKLKNVGLFTLSDEDGYTGFGSDFFLRGWIAFVIADVFKNIENALRVLAFNKSSALKIFKLEWEKIQEVISSKPINEIFEQLKLSATILKKIEKRFSISSAKKVSVIGEIFVRHDEFSKMDLIDRLAEKDFVVTVAPISEYVYYSNYLENKNNPPLTIKDLLYNKIKSFEQKRIERKIKTILAETELVEFEMIDIESVINIASKFISPELEGEAILTIGTALKEILNHSCGIISIGPFGCMPSRVAESILNIEMNYEAKLKGENRIDYLSPNFSNLPFLAIETDGNQFPQIIQSKIEIFMLNAERIHFKLKGSKNDTLSDSLKALINYVVTFYTDSINESDKTNIIPSES